jgi:hypothetical protein
MKPKTLKKRRRGPKHTAEKLHEYRWLKKKRRELEKEKNK